MAIEFITTRELANKAGEAKGKIRIVKLKEQPKALIDYNCPECGFSEKRHELWQEPLVTGKGVNKKFFVRCSKCGNEMHFLKLKKEAKKKKK